MDMHPDDLFHPPTSDDPFWTETCWFTFAVPERKLSGQLYPFFRANQGVTSGEKRHEKQFRRPRPPEHHPREPLFHRPQIGVQNPHKPPTTPTRNNRHL